MFEVGQSVVCGNKGVCTIEDITTLELSGIDKEKMYFILKPQYMSSSTIYVPVESSHTSMRVILTKEEATELVSSIPSLPIIKIENEKLLEQEYKARIKANNCTELISVIKTIHNRKQERKLAGRKETAIDSKYFKMVEANLYGELAIALDMPKEEVSNSIFQILESIQ